MARVIWITISDPDSPDAEVRLFNPVWPLRPLINHFNHERRLEMPDRNAEILQRIVNALGEGSPPDALARLEREFENSLLIVAGDLNDIARHAEQLRLAITEPERGAVLDYIGRNHIAEITIDHVEDAINTLFPDRFIEP
jgi:hypothetical protein